MAKLDDKKVKAITGPEPGKTVMRIRDDLADGLWLRVTKHTTKAGEERVSKSWEVFFTLNGKTSCTGIGKWVEPPTGDMPQRRGLTVKQARRKAFEIREMVDEGRNPVEERKAARNKPDAPKVVTFADALGEYMKTDYIQKNLSSDKHRKQWRSSLDLHVVPKLGAKPVGTISIDDVKDVLKPIWSTKTDTARRVRQRMESVFAWAIDEGCRETDNPASTSALQIWIKNQRKAQAANHPAIQQSDLPTWFAELRKREGIAARALEFATLCASRSGEVRGMTFGEIDLKAKVWTIPAARMKMKKAHSVPLSEAAVALLKALPHFDAEHQDPKALVFPAPRGGVMSDMSISAVMKRMHQAKLKADGQGWVDPNVLTTPEDPDEEPQPRPAVPHALRSSFKDFCTKRGFDNIQSEIALAHNVGNEVEQRYRRDDLVEERRAMMEAFAGFCHGEKPVANVVPMRGAV